MEHLQPLYALLKTPKRIVLLAHPHPDADAMGACLSLKLYLERTGHIADVIVPDDFPHFLDWMTAADKTWVYQKKAKTCFAILSQSDIIFCCDFNALSRIDKLGEEVVKMRQALLVMIDHHRDADHFANYELWDPAASSTCELIYKFIEGAGHEALIDAEMGSMIYAGIAMDTGIFQYSSTTPGVHILAANLMRKGVQIETVHNNLYHQYKENRLRFIGYLLSQKLEVLENERTAIMSITMQEAEDFKLGTGDKEGIVNMPLTLKQIQLSILLTEDKDKIKISFRSKGNVDVNAFANAYFNGGGHKNASGGYYTKNLEDTVGYLKEILPGFIQNYPD